MKTGKRRTKWEQKQTMKKLFMGGMAVVIILAMVLGAVLPWMR